MMNQIIEDADQLFQKYRKITPILIMVKFKLTYEKSVEVCKAVWLMNHLKARKIAKKITPN